jgi:hypothetical protein
MRAVRRAVLVAFAVSATLLAPAAARAASISGTVTDESTLLGIAGIDVCTNTLGGGEPGCDETDSTGAYSISGLPAGEYWLSFSAYRNNLKYVSEIYDDKEYQWEADTLTLAAGEELQGIDAQLGEGGSISGTVTDEATGEPIAGIAACAIDHEGIPQRCALTDADGTYDLHGLRSGDYDIEYEGWNRVNYLTEFYEDAATWAAATDLIVTAPETISGIDAKLARGAEILGHVSDVASGAPVTGAMVCAPPESVPYGEINENCDWTDSEGNYAIRSLPAGRYQVAFDVEFSGGPGDGPVVGQWWKEAGTRAAATVLELTPPQTVAAVDGKVSLPFYGPYPLEEQVPPPAAAPTQPPVQRPLAKCKKGFHRKLVKGKNRCVRKHRHRRAHHRRHHG